MNFDILVKEEKASLPLTREELLNIAQKCFELSNKKQGDISLVVCNDDFISSLNERYLGEKGPTDVLAFPQREGSMDGFNDRVLGDIVISIETAENQAIKLGSKLREEFIHLFVHGLLHLIGFDHDNDENKIQMELLTEKILSEVKESP